jgi:hypothetical protein
MLELLIRVLAVFAIEHAPPWLLAPLTSLGAIYATIALLVAGTLLVTRADVARKLRA